MMSHDVKMSETIIRDEVSNRFEPQSDERWKRDCQQDLHDAIDLVNELSHKLKDLHPIALKRIKMLISEGDFL